MQLAYSSLLGCALTFYRTSISFDFYLSVKTIGGRPLTERPLDFTILFTLYVLQLHYFRAELRKSSRFFIN